MKRFIAFILTMTLALPCTSFAAESNIKVKINGTEVAFPDAKPYVDQSSRTLVPVRFISESLGGQVDWNAPTKTVTIKKGKVIKLKIGSTSVTVDNANIELDTKPVITSSRTFVPLRFISEAFGATVGWESKTKTVNITIPSTASVGNSTTVENNASSENKALADMIRTIVNYEVNGEYNKVYDYLNPNDIKENNITKDSLNSNNTFVSFGFLKLLKGTNKNNCEVKCYFEKKSDTEISVTYGIFENKSEIGSHYNIRLLHKIDGKWYIDMEPQSIANIVARKYNECI